MNNDQHWAVALIRQYGWKAILSFLLLMLIIWGIVHKLAAPGSEVSVFLGLHKYIKNGNCKTFGTKLYWCQWISIHLNTYVKLKIKHVFSLRKTAGKIAMFFAQRVRAIKFTEFLIKGIAANAVVIGFMILPAGGLTDLIYRLKNGFGS